MKNITKKQIENSTIVKHVRSNVYSYSFQTEKYIFTTSSEQRLIIENKEDGTIKQYGDAMNKKEFISNVHEYLNN